VIYVTSFKSFTLPSEPSRELRILRMLCTLPAAAYLQSTTLHDLKTVPHYVTQTTKYENSVSLAFYSQEGITGYLCNRKASDLNFIKGVMPSWRFTAWKPWTAPLKYS